MKRDELLHLTQDELIDLISEMEEQFKITNDHASQLISELEAINTKLYETRAELVHAARLSTIGGMVSCIIHELKNPLHVFTLGLDLIREIGSIPMALEPSISNLEKANEKMTAVVRNLQASVRAGHTDKKVERFSLKNAIEDLLNLQKFYLMKNKILWKFTTETRDVFIEGDKFQIESVFENLIGNSIDAFQDISMERDRTIKVTLSTDDDTVSIFYQDNAGGMLKSVQEHLFEPFFTTKSEQKGTWAWDVYLSRHRSSA